MQELESKSYPLMLDTDSRHMLFMCSGECCTDSSSLDGSLVNLEPSSLDHSTWRTTHTKDQAATRIALG